MTQPDDSQQPTGTVAGKTESVVEARVRAAGERARAEAEARRARQDAATTARPKERNGRGGLDPVRYDDWEIKGLTADF